MLSLVHSISLAFLQSFFPVHAERADGSGRNGRAEPALSGAGEEGIGLQDREHGGVGEALGSGPGGRQISDDQRRG